MPTQTPVLSGMKLWVESPFRLGLCQRSKSFWATRKNYSSLLSSEMSLYLMSRLELMLMWSQIAGAAAFGAFKYYEDQQRKEGMSLLLLSFSFPYLSSYILYSFVLPPHLTSIHLSFHHTRIRLYPTQDKHWYNTTGKPVEHAFAKEALAGLAAGEVDKLAETKGMDFVDRERAKHAARENVNNMYDQHYGGQDNYDPWVLPVFGPCGGSLRVWVECFMDWC